MSASPVDANHLRAQWELLAPNAGDVLEIRLIDTNRGRVEGAGYFDNAQAAIGALEKAGKDRRLYRADTYLTLNPPDPRLLARYANRIEVAPKLTTSDKDILCRRWLLVDLDAERPAGISASDEEVGAARSLGRCLYQFLLAEQGIAAASVASMTSGNGCYLLLRLPDLPNDQASKDLCQRVLEGLAHRFNTPTAKIDATTFNAARLLALCGSVKGKGDPTPERPHRRVEPKAFPDSPVAVTIRQLEALAALAPTVGSKGNARAPGEGGSQERSAGPKQVASLDWVNAFLLRHPDQIETLGDWQADGDWRRRYVVCPWDSNHRGTDAYLAVSSDGKIAFHCSHDSCRGQDWQALRALVGEAKSTAGAQGATLKTYERSAAGGFVGFESSPEEESENFRPVFEGPPRPLTLELAPVPTLPAQLLPERLRAWLADIAERVGCPLEYVAAPALVALSSVIGRRVGLRPKRYDDWTVVPNLWGAIIGRPGSLKSPAIAEALRPLHRLEAEAREQHERVVEAYQTDALVAQACAEAAKAALKKEAAKVGADREELRLLALDALEGENENPPTLRRHIVNDSTVEKLGELLRENPNGLLIYRDELTGLLRGLDKQGHETDRAFYLEGWNGTGSFTFDRIGRGTVHLPALCLSLFGGIQPGPLRRWLRSCAQGEESDGFASRLQVLFYPDPPREFGPVDRWPDTAAKSEAYQIFQRLSQITPESVGAEEDPGGGIPFLHFDHEAQERFDTWRKELENRLLQTDESPLMLEHLSKFRSLLPSLALIFHLCEVGQGPVGLAAVEYAALWAQVLELHARRVYQSVADADPEAAAALGARLKEGDALPDPFTARLVLQKGWAGLSTTEEVARALGLLEDRRWIRAVAYQPVNEEGRPSGRPTDRYFVHPALQGLRKNADSSSGLPSKPTKGLRHDQPGA